MRFLVDENVDRQVAEALRSNGHDVAEAGGTDAGDDDASILERARTEARLLVTGDKDFGELVYRQKRVTAGVLLVRLAGLSPEQKAAIVVRVVAAHATAMLGAFTVVTAGSTRIRRGE